MNEYNEIKKAFFQRHGLKEVFTSAMVNDSYHKEYIGERGGVFYEVMSPVWERAEVRGVAVDVKLFRVEYWSTDDAKSRYYFEKY